MATPPINDVIEIEQLLATYALAMTQQDIERVMNDVFASDGTYSAFGTTYCARRLPRPRARRRRKGCS